MILIVAVPHDLADGTARICKVHILWTFNHDAYNIHDIYKHVDRPFWKCTKPFLIGNSSVDITVLNATYIMNVPHQPSLGTPLAVGIESEPKSSKAQRRKRGWSLFNSPGSCERRKESANPFLVLSIFALHWFTHFTASQLLCKGKSCKILVNTFWDKVFFHFGNRVNNVS